MIRRKIKDMLHKHETLKLTKSQVRKFKKQLTAAQREYKKVQGNTDLYDKHYRQGLYLRMGVIKGRYQEAYNAMIYLQYGGQAPTSRIQSRRDIAAHIKNELLKWQQRALEVRGQIREATSDPKMDKELYELQLAPMVKEITILENALAALDRNFKKVLEAREEHARKNV